MGEEGCRYGTSESSVRGWILYRGESLSLPSPLVTDEANRPRSGLVRTKTPEKLSSGSRRQQRRAINELKTDSDLPVTRRTTALRHPTAPLLSPPPHIPSPHRPPRRTTRTHQSRIGCRRSLRPTPSPVDTLSTEEPPECQSSDASAPTLNPSQWTSTHHPANRRTTPNPLPSHLSPTLTTHSLPSLPPSYTSNTAVQNLNTAPLPTDNSNLSQRQKLVCHSVKLSMQVRTGGQEK